jgi:hypothetical protein
VRASTVLVTAAVSDPTSVLRTVCCASTATCLVFVFAIALRHWRKVFVVVSVDPVASVEAGAGLSTSFTE